MVADLLGAEPTFESLDVKRYSPSYSRAFFFLQQVSPGHLARTSVEGRPAGPGPAQVGSYQSLWLAQRYVHPDRALHQHRVRSSAALVLSLRLASSLSAFSNSILCFVLSENDFPSRFLNHKQTHRLSRDRTCCTRP